MKLLEQMTIGDCRFSVITQSDFQNFSSDAHICVSGSKSPLAVIMQTPDGQESLLAIDEDNIDRKTIIKFMRRESPAKN